MSETKAWKNRARLCPIKRGYCEKERCYFWEEDECLIKTLVIHLLFQGDKDSPIHVRKSSVDY